MSPHSTSVRGDPDAFGFRLTDCLGVASSIPSIIVWRTRFVGNGGNDIAKSPHMARIGASPIEWSVFTKSCE